MGKQRGEQTERERRERHGLRAHRDCKTHRNTIFEVLTPGFIDFQHYATLYSVNRKNESFRLKIFVWYLDTLRPRL